MKLTAWTLLFLLMIQLPVGAHNKCDKAACAEIKEKIRTIESQMRSGYTRAQGERYEARLRELKAKRYQLCR